MNKYGYILLGALLATIILLPLILREPFHEPQSRIPQTTGSSSSLAEDIAHVVRAVDGDTLLVTMSSGKEERVRIIGIDAPESVDPNRKDECYGDEASSRMHELVDGKDVQLIPEEKDDRDTYGRLLRFISLEGKDIGAEMISEGYAENYCSHFPHPRCDEYDQLERDASREKKGMWSACK